MSVKKELKFILKRSKNMEVLNIYKGENGFDLIMSNISKINEYLTKFTNGEVYKMLDTEEQCFLWEIKDKGILVALQCYFFDEDTFEPLKNMLHETGWKIWIEKEKREDTEEMSEKLAEDLKSLIESFRYWWQEYKRVNFCIEGGAELIYENKDKFTEFFKEKCFNGEEVNFECFSIDEDLPKGQEKKCLRWFTKTREIKCKIFEQYDIVRYQTTAEFIFDEKFNKHLDLWNLISSLKYDWQK